MNTTLLKRILGVILASHIMPLICMLSLIGDKGNTPLWIPYFAGWILNIAGLVFYGFVLLILWCFGYYED